MSQRWRQCCSGLASPRPHSWSATDRHTSVVSGPERAPWILPANHVHVDSPSQPGTKLSPTPLQPHGVGAGRPTRCPRTRALQANRPEPHTSPRSTGTWDSRSHVALAGILAPRPHQRLVLAHPESLALHDACALGPRLVLVVGVLFQVLAAQPRLLLVVRLLLLVGHGLPAGAWSSPRGRPSVQGSAHPPQPPRSPNTWVCTSI